MRSAQGTFIPDDDPRRDPGHARPVVLLADPNAVSRTLAAGRLQDQAIDVTECDDGRDAWEWLHYNRCDLAVLSLDMPSLTGLRLLAQIRAHPRLKHLPVIVVTATDDQGLLERCYALGATAFVAQPVDWTVFVYQVRFALRTSVMEEDLRVATTAANSAAELKANLLSLLGHELRTPLHHLIGFAEVLVKEAEGPLGGEAYQTYAGHIIDGGKRLLATLSDVMLLSRITSGAQALVAEPYDLGELLNDLEELFSHRAGLRQVGLSIQEPASDVMLLCDRGLVLKGVGALIDNAIKFSPEGTEVDVRARLRADGKAHFVVEDDGPGIPFDKLADVCAPFSQLDMRHDRKAEGLGLGLPLARAIAELHGGDIDLRPQPEGGLIAELAIPMSGDEEDILLSLPPLAET
ncbi:MAG: hybrid sensor histidine kinase/response regulator [Pseudomonadota bacterium]